MEWASPWDNSNTANLKQNNEKRMPTMNRNVISSSSTNRYDDPQNNMQPPLNMPSTSYREPMSIPSNNKTSNEYVNVKPYLETNPNIEKINQENNDSPIMINSIQSNQIVNEQRNSKINKLIEKMTTVQSSNDGSGLSDFNPPPRPEINTKNSFSPNDLLPNGNTDTPAYSNKPISTSTANYRPVNNSMLKGEGYTELGSYKKVYEPPEPKTGYIPYYARQNYGTDSNKQLLGDDQLLKKINYMIHLLEEQKKEKTDNVVEEFILYSFLGIFVIYIVDSFSRTGKYTR